MHTISSKMASGSGMVAPLNFSEELRFTEEMLHGNIKALSFYLIKQYLKKGNAVLATNFSTFLSFLADYCMMCENPGDSLVFVKVLNILVLANKLHQLREEEREEEVVKVTQDLEETLLQLKCDCPEKMEPHAEQLEKLINEARCQTVLSYLKCKKMQLALDHWQAYSEKAASPHSKALFSRLKDLLHFHDEDGEVLKDGDEMQAILCLDLFTRMHSWAVFCRNLRHFVSGCVVELEQRVPMFRDSTKEQLCDMSTEEKVGVVSGEEDRMSVDSVGKPAVAGEERVEGKGVVAEGGERENLAEVSSTSSVCIGAEEASSSEGNSGQENGYPVRRSSRVAKGRLTAAEKGPNRNDPTITKRGLIGKKGQIGIVREMILRGSEESSSSSCLDSDESGPRRSRRRRAAAKEAAAASAVGDKGYTSSDTTTYPNSRKEGMQEKKTVTWDETVTRGDQLPRISVRKALASDLVRSSDDSADSDNVTTAPEKSGGLSVTTGRDADSERAGVGSGGSDGEESSGSDGEESSGKWDRPGTRTENEASSPTRKVLSLQRTSRKHSWSTTEVCRRSGGVESSKGGSRSMESVESPKAGIDRTEGIESPKGTEDKVSDESHRTESSENDVVAEDSPMRKLRSRIPEGGCGPILHNLRHSRRRSHGSEEKETRDQVSEERDSPKLRVAGSSKDGDEKSDSPELRVPRRVAGSSKDDDEKRDSPKLRRAVSEERDIQDLDSPGRRDSPRYNFRSSRRGGPTKGTLRNTDGSDDTGSDGKSPHSRGSKSSSSRWRYMSSSDNDESDSGVGSKKYSPRGVKTGASSSRTALPQSPSRGSRSLPQSPSRGSPSRGQGPWSAGHTPYISKRTLVRKNEGQAVYDLMDDFATPPSRLPARIYDLTLKPASNFEPKKRPIQPISSKHSIPKAKRHGLGRKFSTSEVEYLQEGIKKCGSGKWREILKMYPFHPSRTSISLKDKARNLKGRIHS